MGTIHKTVTAAVAAANQANSAASTGPVTESGKEQSKLNAFKSGKYARRPNPVEMLLNDRTEEEAAECGELRAEMVRCYQPADDFARLQAEELADLQFELRRLERAREVVRARERELLELEQRKRALRLKEGVEASSKEITDRGLIGQPDSPGKFREMLRTLESLVDRDDELEIDKVRTLVYRVYGDGERAWRGVRLRWALTSADQAETDEQRAQASQDFEKATRREIELVREELAICELEEGPLSAVAEATRLLEATNSRKWSWMQQREMFLRRSIDRKVRMLIDLRREANRAEGRTAEKGEDKAGAGQQGPGQGPGQAPSGEEPPPPGGSDNTSPEERDSAPNPEEHGARNVAPEVEAALRRHSNGGLNPPLRKGQNQGTKPLSALISAGASCASRMVRANPASGSISKDVPWEAHSVNENRRCSSKRC